MDFSNKFYYTVYFGHFIICLRNRRVLKFYRQYIEVLKFYTQDRNRALTLIKGLGGGRTSEIENRMLKRSLRGQGWIIISVLEMPTH